MTKLPLAVDIAEAVLDADQQIADLDIAAVAEQLFRAHPEADVSRREIAEALIEEVGNGPGN